MTRREEILQAARNEFVNEGYAGARLQAIADNIGVTKAMIHYYYDTKENIFKEVYRAATHQLIGGLMEILEEPIPLFPKIDAFIDQAFERFRSHEPLVRFVVYELNHHPELTRPIFREVEVYDASELKRQLQQAADNYEIAPAQGSQIVANLLSLCIFPFIGAPFLQDILGEADDAYQEFLNRRREVIKDTLINALASG